MDHWHYDLPNPVFTKGETNFEELPTEDYITRRQQLQMKAENAETRGKRGKAKAKAKGKKAVEDDDDNGEDAATESKTNA